MKHISMVDVSVAGNNITQAVQDHLVDLTVYSVAGVSTDSFSMELGNEKGKIKWPGAGAIVSISMGFKDTGLTFLGSYQVDERRKRLGPSRIVARGTAAKFLEKFKAPKERSFDDTTLGSILSQIASENGWQGKIDPALSSITIKHIEQKESDAEFVTRLANRYGAMGKPEGDFLIFAGRYSSDHPVLGIDFATERAPFSAELVVSERPQITGYRTYYLDEDTGQRKAHVEGGGDIIFDHQQQDMFEDLLTATAVATAQLKTFQNQGDALQMTILGDPRLAAGQILIVSNLDDEIDGRPWSLQRVTHSFNGSGYRTSITAHAPSKD